MKPSVIISPETRDPQPPEIPIVVAHSLKSMSTFPQVNCFPRAYLKSSSFLLISDNGTCRASQWNQIKLFEPNFLAPSTKICCSKIKGITKFNKHIQ